MAEPTAAERARRYLDMLGVHQGPRSRARPTVEDDDIDVEIGAARMEPDIDVDVGPARMLDDEDEMIGASPRETVVPEISIVGDPRRDSPRLGSIMAALPESLSEPLGRAIDDDDSVIGEAYRTLAGAADYVGAPDALSNESLGAMEAYGRSGLDALPFGYGDEIDAYQLDQMSGGAYSRPRPLRDDETTTTRGLDQAMTSDRDRDRAHRRQLRREHPIASAVGTVAGSLPGAALVPGPTAVGRGARILQAARNNAVVGGVTGYGLSDEDEMIGSGGGDVAGQITGAEDDELIGGRLGDAAESALYGGVLGGTFQALGEGFGAARDLYRAARNPTGPVLDAVGPRVADIADVSQGPRAADDVRRLLAAEDAGGAARPGMFPDDDHVIGAARTSETHPANPRSWLDDMPPDPETRYPFDPDDTLEAQLRRLRARDPDSTVRGTPSAEDVARSQEGTAAAGGRRRMRPTRTPATPEPAPVELADEADVVSLNDDVMPSEAMPPDEDEFIGAVTERPVRPAPTMPEQGPSLRAAAARGERSFGARGDAALDPSIQATDELSAMARDYAEIESGAGGFQPIKERRIREAMQASPPPAGWESRSMDALDAMRTRLDQITRHAGANARLTGPVGQARLMLDDAERALRAGSEFGTADPSTVWSMLNRANMSVGRAAAAEARGTGSGMQHTSGFAEPLTTSYQQMRAFLASPEAWGAPAATVQREMNAATAPLMRTSRALRDRVGSLFSDSGEQVAGGGGFRTYETARPEAVRGLIDRSGDDAFRGERELLRAWVENYGEQGATLARLAEDPALGQQAQAMQARAGRLLDILDRAEVDGRAAEMLRGVQDVRPGMGRGPSVGQMVRLAARIESGEITAPEWTLAVEALDALERGLGRTARATATAQPVGERVTDDMTSAAFQAPIETPSDDEPEEQRFVPRRLRPRDESMPPTTPEPLSDGDEYAPFNPLARRANSAMR